MDPSASGDQSDPARRHEEAVVTVMSAYEHVEIQFDEFRAPVSGRYRLKFAGYTVWMSPDFSKVSKGRRTEPITIYSDFPVRILRRLGNFDFGPEPSVQEIEVWLKAGETIRPDAARLVRSRPPHFKNPFEEEDGMPGVAYQWMEVEGPLIESWPPSGHKTAVWEFEDGFESSQCNGQLPYRGVSQLQTAEFCGRDARYSPWYLQCQ